MLKRTTRNIAFIISPALRAEITKTLILHESIDGLLPKARAEVEKDLARLTGTVLAAANYGASVEKANIAKILELPDILVDTRPSHPSRKSNKSSQCHQNWPQKQRSQGRSLLGQSQESINQGPWPNVHCR